MKYYPDFGHPQGMSVTPWFKLKGDKLYPDFGHPNGVGAAPWFKIK
ncbi:hypothetical protein ACFLS4_03335 [Bacteroidota bacterium]